LQLFERAEGFTSHWEDDDIKGTITKTLQDEFPKIEYWLDRVNSIEDIRKIGYEQLKDNKYCMHHPDQKYVLAFIEAKCKILRIKNTVKSISE
jgi:excinuclease UvrABC helicase subunit UvrB